jgi:membrane-bound inhibitor of C-type lysozyme
MPPQNVPPQPQPTLQEQLAPRRRGLLLVIIFIIIAALAAVVVWEYRHNPLLAQLLGTNPPSVVPLHAPLASVEYVCDEGKTIKATYYEKNVALQLSDGRSMTLPQTISGSGVRYANSDESFVFWNKGDTAFVQEGGGDPPMPTYQNCVDSSIGGGQSTVFASTTMGISARYPTGYTVKTEYKYNFLGQDIPFDKVTFIIPPTLWQGTNLSGFDTGVSIEQWPNTTVSVSGQSASTTCSAIKFLEDQNGGQKKYSISQNGTTYDVASTTDAGAGNFYEEAVYAIQGSHPCTAVRYFIHSTNIGNYTPGTVQAYDRATLLSQFDSIRKSLLLNAPASAQ